MHTRTTLVNPVTQKEVRVTEWQKSEYLSQLKERGNPTYLFREMQAPYGLVVGWSDSCVSLINADGSIS